MKIFILTIACLFMVGSSLAQNAEIGVKAGVNFCKFDSFGDKLLPGMNASAYGSIEVRNFKIQGEVVYSQQGASSEVTFVNTSTNQGTQVDLKTNVNYLNVPVLLKFDLGKGFNFLVGPQTGFILTAKSQFIQNGSSVLTEDIKKSIKTDFSAVAGLNYEFTNGIRLDARYNFGLTDVGNYSANRVIQISIGYRLFKFGE